MKKSLAWLAPLICAALAIGCEEQPKPKEPTTPKTMLGSPSKVPGDSKAAPAEAPKSNHK